MCELAFEHVETDLVLARWMAFAVYKEEFGLGVNEATNEPCGCYPVHFDGAPRYPSLTQQVVFIDGSRHPGDV